MLTVSTQLGPLDDLATFARMLQSVAFADKILVFNLDHPDPAASVLLAKVKAKVIRVKTPKVVEIIRARQIKESQTEWVLIMDYDEVIPQALAREILSLVRTPNPQFGAYSLLRRNFSLGYPLNHGGFEKDLLPRLFRRSQFVSWPKEIHSLPLVRGGIGTCQNWMEHHKDASLSQMVQKTNRYTDVEAAQFFRANTPPVTSLTLLRKTLMEFVRRYFLKAGLLDGRIGLIQALYQSYAIFLRYAKLYTLQTATGKKL